MIGSGPAGLAVAAAAAERGLRVRCISEAADAPWPANYGIWVDDAQRAGVNDALEASWESVDLVGSGGEARVLPRAYAVVDRTALRRRYLDALPAGALVAGRVERVERRDDGARTLATTAGEIVAGAVVDCGGAGTGASRSGGARAPAWQIAFGREARVLGGMDPTRAVLMDWSWDPADGGPPAFLYALPRGGDRVFVEETVLASRPAASIELVASRLERRMAARGVELAWLDAPPERCRIPMGGGIRRADVVVPFGAAAGLVHPATGYSLGHTLALVPGVADALQERLAANDREGAASAAGEVIWSAQRVAAWRLYDFGLESLLRLDQRDLGAFFEAFLGLPAQRWAPYVSAQANPGEIRATMLRVFARAPMRVRLQLAAAALGLGSIG